VTLAQISIGHYSGQGEPSRHGSHDPTTGIAVTRNCPLPSYHSTRTTMTTFRLAVSSVHGVGSTLGPRERRMAVPAGIDAAEAATHRGFVRGISHRYTTPLDDREGCHHRTDTADPAIAAVGISGVGLAT
jgi:hypothetical protein